MSTRTPYKGRLAALSNIGGRARAADPIPTVEEAKRRLAAASDREQPWLHISPDVKAAMAAVEDEAGGRLVGPEVYRPSDAA